MGSALLKEKQPVYFFSLLIRCAFGSQKISPAKFRRAGCQIDRLAGPALDAAAAVGRVRAAAIQAAEPRLRAEPSRAALRGGAPR